MFYVYVIFRLNGTPCYVGKGKGNRYLDHAKGSHNIHLRRIYKKSDRELPAVILQEGLCEQDAFAAEMALIAVIGRLGNKTGPLVNMTDGGEGTSGHVVSADARARLRAAHTGRVASDETRANMRRAQAGKVISAETKKKTSATLSGRTRSNETKKRMSVAMTGRVLSVETRERMSAAGKGRVFSEEHKKKLNIAAIGHKQSDERKKRSSEARIGHVHSEEHKNKISASLKGKKKPPRSTEHRQSISAAKKGKPWSDARRAAMKPTLSNMDIEGNA